MIDPIGIGCASPGNRSADQTSPIGDTPSYFPETGAPMRDIDATAGIVGEGCVGLPARSVTKRLRRSDRNRLSSRKALDPDGDRLIDQRITSIQDDQLGLLIRNRGASPVAARSLQSAAHPARIQSDASP